MNPDYEAARADWFTASSALLDHLEHCKDGCRRGGAEVLCDAGTALEDALREVEDRLRDAS